MSTLAATEHIIQIELETTPHEELLLSDAWRFLANTSRVFEVARLGTDPKYESYRFPPRLRIDEPLPLLPADRARVERIKFESPLELVTAWIAVGGGIIGAIWVIVQIYEKLYSLRLNHEKLELEVRKLRHDVIPAAGKIPESAEETFSLLDSRGGVRILDSAAGELAASPIQVRRAEIVVFDAAGGAGRWTIARQ